MKYRLITLFLISILFTGTIINGNDNLSVEKKNQNQLALAQARHDKKLQTQVKKNEQHQKMAQIYADSGKQTLSKTNK